jgi:rRNA biogenesis protein RRP5
VLLLLWKTNLAHRYTLFICPNPIKMAVGKRSADDAAVRPQKKARTEASKSSTSAKPSAPTKPTVNPVFSSALVADETDFPRGGGTSLTPLELKETREAGKKQAELEVQAVSTLASWASYRLTGTWSSNLWR